MEYFIRSHVNSNNVLRLSNLAMLQTILFVFKYKYHTVNTPQIGIREMKECRLLRSTE